MGIIENIQFSVQKNIQKWIKGAAAGIVAALASLCASKLGVQLTQEQEVALIAIVSGAFLGILNFIKVKFPQFAGWL